MASIPRAQPPNADASFILRARVLLPMVGPPIENGAILVFRDRIAVAGAAYRGVGIPACIASGRAAAQAVT